MSTLLIALIPVAALACVFLVGFVGCTQDFDRFTTGGDGPPEGGDGPPPDGGPTVGYADVVKGDGPIVYWRLVEDAGPTAADEIGIDAAHPTGLHPGTYLEGTPIAAATDSAAAPGTLTFGSAAGLLANDTKKSISFDGGYMEAPHDGTLNPPQFSIEAWIHPAWTAGDTSYRIVVASYVFGPPTTGFTLEKNVDDHFEISVGTGAGGWSTLVGDTSFQKGKDETYHLVATYDGTTLKIYEDGNLTNQMDVAGYMPAGTTPIDIGVGEPTANKLYPFEGQIQDVAVYDHALDDATVQNHYLKGTT